MLFRSVLGCATSTTGSRQHVVEMGTDTWWSGGRINFVQRSRICPTSLNRAAELPRRKQEKSFDDCLTLCCERGGNLAARLVPGHEEQGETRPPTREQSRQPTTGWASRSCTTRTATEARTQGTAWRTVEQPSDGGSTPENPGPEMVSGKRERRLGTNTLNFWPAIQQPLLVQ